MSVLHLGPDTPVYDGCFADNLDALFEQHATPRDGYRELSVALDGTSQPLVTIICIEQTATKQGGPIVCDECRVVGALPARKLAVSATASRIHGALAWPPCAYERQD